MAKDWKPWSKTADFEIRQKVKSGTRFRLKLKNGEEIYDDYKYRGSFGWGFSGYAYSVGIVEYAEF
ncbi:MAG: hypothetical protein II304_02230 [Bacteroidales bacterium]|nr:hypothetical protein [Bacteroidales bacterium]